MRPPAFLVAVRPKGAQALDVNEVRARLVERGADVQRVTPRAPTRPHTLWEAELVLRDGEVQTTLEISVGPAPLTTQQIAQFSVMLHDVRESDVVAAGEASTSVHVRVVLADPLYDFHAALRVLATLAPDCVVLLDFDALRAHTGAWLEEIASQSTPPAPETLFFVHAVSDGGYAWLHTHGLARTGTMELDACDVPRDLIGEAGHLLNTVAKQMIERGAPPSDEEFVPGAKLPVVWLPWELGVAHVSGSGGRRDRDDETHAGERGLLFVKERGLFGGAKYRSIARHATVLRAHPIFYLTNMESQRAASLARERFDRFAALRDRFGGRGDWKFLVKLGYEADDAKGENDREHLWFEVISIREGHIEATCMNQAHRIARLVPGVHGMHPVTRLSGITILTLEHGSFDADTLPVLERQMAS